MRTTHYSLLGLLLLSACGGGGGGTPAVNADNNANPPAAQTSFTLSGSVPGTKIEVFGENGSYYTTNSNNDGSNRHPFTLSLPTKVSYYLVMTTNENDANAKIVTPISFYYGNGEVTSRFSVTNSANVDLGYIDLPMDRNAIAAEDRDGDGVLDQPRRVDNPPGEISRLPPPADGNTWDHDGDGVHNRYDKDYEPAQNVPDRDRDGLPDAIDANPDNDENHHNKAGPHGYLDNDRDGYLDDDHDRDGYHDDDRNRDGYHDDDRNRDGYHDDDNDRDGYHDDDHDRDGYHDDDRDRDGYHDDDRDGNHDDDRNDRDDD